MDVFADLFRAVRAQGALFGSSTLTAPWNLRFVDGAPLTLCTVLDGAGWVVVDGHPPEHLSAGDIVVVAGPTLFSFVDDLTTRAEPVECGQACAAPEQGGTSHRLGWHDEPDDLQTSATTMVAGAYPLVGDIGRRLLDALPVVFRVDAGGAAGAVRQLLATEVAIDAPGQQVVLDRLLDWMLVCAIREFFERPATRAPAWYAAHRDPVVGKALRLLHGDPSRAWTIADLAAQARVSRATMAKRFTDLVGEPPLRYLTKWRMTLASDLLSEDRDATLSEVAHAVGYADAFGLSAAFKRNRGMSPTHYRERTQPAAAPNLDQRVDAR